MMRALKKCSIEVDVVTAEDGQEALDYLLASGPHAGRDPEHQPDVIISDLKLPRIDGLELLRRIRADERTQGLPFVLLSSSREVEDVRHAYLLGASSFVWKPVNSTDFSHAVRQLAAYWLVLNEQLPSAPPAATRRVPAGSPAGRAKRASDVSGRVRSRRPTTNAP